MRDLDDRGGGELPNAKVHCWDPQERRMVCGERGQIGTTEHVRTVTCTACLELLGRPSQTVSLSPT